MPMSLELVPKLSWLGAARPGDNERRAGEGSGLWATATSNPARPGDDERRAGEPRTPACAAKRSSAAGRPSPEPTGVLGHPLSIVSQDGMTLTEILIASTVAMVVLFGIVTTDVARFRVGEDLRRRSGVMSLERGNAALAVIHLTKHLERADRIDLGNAVPGLYQLRTPAGCAGGAPPPASCFDDPTKYVWDQYRWNNVLNQIEFNTMGSTGTCGAWTVISRQIAVFTMQYKDEGFPPPGTLPLDKDNNMALCIIQWNDPASGLSQTFQNQVAIRARAYANVDTRGAPPGISEPPVAACP